VTKLADPYRLLDGPPSVSDYLRLRSESGLTPRRRDQAEAALRGSWSAVRVDADEATVGMGRVLGDGGWYFHIVDIAVLPAHQGRGLGAAILEGLLDRIQTSAPPGAFVNLLADRPGRALYRRFGFVETAPDSIGMALTIR
jgi:ribosomal protein S18 acetylase RimI-like enzyme